MSGICFFSLEGDAAVRTVDFRTLVSAVLFADVSIELLNRGKGLNTLITNGRVEHCKLEVLTGNRIVWRHF